MVRTLKLDQEKDKRRIKQAFLDKTW